MICKGYLSHTTIQGRLLLFSLFFHGLLRPKYVTEATKCWLVGKPVRFVPTEDVKGLLQYATGDDAIGQHMFQKLLRISINNKIYYSEDYKRMNKRVSYAVMFEKNGAMEFGLSKHFIHDKESGETYAVVDVPKTTDAPDTLAKFALHHIWLSKERWGFVYCQCSLNLLVGVLFDSSTQQILQLIILLFG